MKISWRNPWARELHAQQADDGVLRVIECSPGEPVALDLHPGRSYLLRATDPTTHRTSPILKSGPVVPGSEVKIDPAPMTIGRVRIRLPPGTRYAETVALPSEPAHPQFALSRYEDPGDEPEGWISCWQLGKTTLVLGTASGPLYRQIGVVPPGITLALRQERLGTIEVRDSEEVPVEGAIVELDPLEERPFTTQHMHFPRAMMAGRTDASGRVAVPADDLEGRVVRAWAPGYACGEAMAEGGSCRIVLQAEELERLKLDCSPCEGEVLDLQVRKALGPNDTDTPTWNRPLRGLPLAYASFRDGQLRVSSVARLSFQGSRGTSLELPLPMVEEPRWARTESRFTVVPGGKGMQRVDCGAGGRFDTHLCRSQDGTWNPTAGADTELHLLVLALQDLPVPVAPMPQSWRSGPVILQADGSYPTIWEHSRTATGRPVPEVIELRRAPGKQTTVQVTDPDGKPLGESRIRLAISGYREESRALFRSGRSRLATALATCDSDGRMSVYVPDSRSLDLHVMHPGYADEARTVEAGTSIVVALRPAAWLIVDTDEDWVEFTHERIPRGSEYWQRMFFEFSRATLDRTGLCRPYSKGEPIFMGPLPGGRVRVRGRSGRAMKLDLVVGETVRRGL